MNLQQVNESLSEAVNEICELAYFSKRFKPSGGKGRLLIKFGSHRSRDNAKRTILKGKRQELTSFYRETGHGVYEVTPKEFKKLKASGIKGISKFKDGDDLRSAMEW